MILLDDEEIRVSLQSRPTVKTMDDLVAGLNLVAHAQLKKVVEWMSKDCEEHDHGEDYMWRRRCWDCFEALKKEVGG